MYSKCMYLKKNSHGGKLKIVIKNIKIKNLRVYYFQRCKQVFLTICNPAVTTNFRTLNRPRGHCRGICYGQTNKHNVNSFSII